MIISVHVHLEDDVKLTLTLLALLMGCAAEEEDGFSNSGINPTDDLGSSQSGDDTGDASSDGVSPVISSLSAGFEDYGSAGEALVVRLACSDPQDDLEGGVVSLSITPDSGSGSQYDLTIGEEYAPYDAGDITIAFSDTENSGGYTVSAQVTDVEGNVSNTQETTIE